MRARLEEVGAVFLTGYHRAVECADAKAVCTSLRQVDKELRGFAFEGASMGLALLDWFAPWNSRLLNLMTEGEGNSHIYMLHVGAGWLGARLPFGFRRTLRRMDPLLRWLAFDGWGFHEGFFHWKNHIEGQLAPKQLSGYERRVFDQGLGRSFWFVNGGNAGLIAETISSFAPERRSDLWSGIGLAATYAGIGTEESLTCLRSRCGPFLPSLAQGAAFAAKARDRAGNATDYTDFAARILCNTSVAEAAQITDAAVENLAGTPDEPAYEIWRRRIQHRLVTGAQQMKALYE